MVRFRHVRFTEHQNFRIDRELRAALHDSARRNDRTVGGEIRHAIREQVARTRRTEKQRERAADA